MKSDDPGNCIK